MQRTKYFNQTRPTDTQLNWTETSRVNAMLQRMRSGSQMGVASGFQITINSLDNTKIDIARGEGYSGGIYTINNFEHEGSGERISTYTDSVSGSADTGPAATAQGLADYTASATNYVSLVFSEPESQTLTERSNPFLSHETIVTESFTVSVLTETDWNALTSAQLNNRILVGIVTANGAGVALTSASIDQFVQPGTHPTASDPTTLIGVTVTGLAGTTPLGTGVLRWDTATSTLYWTAPGNSEGVGQQITNSGTFTLYSATTEYSITVSVVYGSLLAVASTSENITVSALYGRAVPMFSAVDQIHRDMVGSGHPTVNNPHGLTSTDIEGGTGDHADLFHVNGISSDADPTQLLCQIDAVNDRIQITNIGSFDNTFLVDGQTYLSLANVATGQPGYVLFDVIPQLISGDYLIYVDSAGVAQRVLIGGRDATMALWTANIDIADMVNTAAGAGVLTWVSATRLLTWEAPGDGAAGAAVYVTETWGGGTDVYLKLYSSNTDNWIVVNVTGTLGGNNSSTVTIALNSVEHSKGAILKIGIVHWYLDTETLTNLRDVRHFNTADNREMLEEEHDINGQHTKVIGHAMHWGGDKALINVNANNSAASINAATATALLVNASAMGLRAIVQGATAGYFEAGQVAGYFEAGSFGAVAKVDDDYGVSAEAGRDYGVYGSAFRSFGVYGSAETFGGYFKANVISGAVGSAVDKGVVGLAGEDYGGSFAASSSYGVYGSAGKVYGVLGAALNSAVAGFALTNEAGRFICGGSSAVYGSAAVNYGGVFTVAANAGTAVSVYAASKMGVYARAVGTAVSATASDIAFQGTASNYAAYLNATATGARVSGGAACIELAGGPIIWGGATGILHGGVTKYIPVIIGADTYALACTKTA